MAKKKQNHKPRTTPQDALLRILQEHVAALQAVKDIADTDGLGDDPAKSEHAYRLVCQAIANATGQPCTGLLGTIEPAALDKTGATRLRNHQRSATQLRDDAVEAIARKELSLETLDARNSDSLDFHEHGVWELRRALNAAYAAGKAAR